MTATDRLNGAIGSLADKAPVVVVTTADITLSGEQTVNSVAVVEGDRVLVMEQDDATENGIWVTETGAWVRAPDFDGNSDAVNGTLVVVASTPLVGFYQLTATNPVVIGTSALTFTKVADIDIAGNLALTTSGQGSALIGSEDAGSLFVGETVEAQLQEIHGTASATAKRTLELATQAEVNTGTDATRVITPVTLEAWAGGIENSFTATLTGFGSNPTGTIHYRISGGMVMLWNETGLISSTSDATAFTMEAIPAALRPTAAVFAPCIALRDNGANAGSCGVTINISGILTFATDQPLNVSGWTGSGIKGIEQGWTLMYPLN